MSKPLISVIMSVYNAEDYLEDSINSILSQTFKDFEFIIVNDGSTDRSPIILNNISLKDKRIIYITRENRGLPKSLNEAISLSKGKYIARMDADDISIDSRLQTQFEFMEKNHSIGVCGTWARKFGDIKKDKVLSAPLKDIDIKSSLVFSVGFVHPTVMLRKSVLLEHGIYYNESYSSAQDYELWINLSAVTLFANIPTVLLNYRITSSSLSSVSNKKNANKRFLLISDLHKKQLYALNRKPLLSELQLHYDLISNLSRVDDCKYTISDISEYLNSLLLSNDRKKLYDSGSLFNLISIKYFFTMYFLFRKYKKVKFLEVDYNLFFYGLKNLLAAKLKMFYRGILS